MTFLDIFALFVLLTLLLTAAGGALVLGWLPGRIAAKRNHPQADAIRICGWLGLVTMGVLLPLAYVWAYLRPVRVGLNAGADPGAPTPVPQGARADAVPRATDLAAEVQDLKGRLAAIEFKLHGSSPQAAPSGRGSGLTATKGERP